MTEEKRCEKTDLLAAQCAHCLGLETRHKSTVPRLNVGKGFSAGYESRCPQCESTIEVGDLITGSDYGYIHVECES